MLTPREHPTFFAKQLIPTHTFRSADTMFAELTGPKREAFLMYLWQEAAKATNSSQPHVAIADGKLSKLEVVGAIKRGGAEVIVVSMPPAENPNEAVFIGLARKPDGVRVFFLERCANDDRTAVNPTEAVLAELRADGMRINHGFAAGLDLDAFKRRVGEVLGVSLDGIERSLPEITAAAFVGAGQAAGAAGTGKKPSVGPLLAGLLAVRAGVPLVMYLLAKVGIRLGIGSVLGMVYQGLSGVIGICLLIWVYQVHAARPGAGSFSPGWSIGVWFIPVVNFFLIPFTIRSAWKTAFGGGGVLLVLLWYVLWLLEIGHQMAAQIGSMPVGGQWTDVWVLAMNWGFFIGIAAYGLLWYIVRSVNERL
jgi:hypothetical protein